jgi:hypothetical protein
MRAKTTNFDAICAMCLLRGSTHLVIHACSIGVDSNE